MIVYPEEGTDRRIACWKLDGARWSKIAFHVALLHRGARQAKNKRPKMLKPQLDKERVFPLNVKSPAAIAFAKNWLASK